MPFYQFILVYGLAAPMGVSMPPPSPGAKCVAFCDLDGHEIVQKTVAPVRLIGSRGTELPVRKRYYDIDLD